MHCAFYSSNKTPKKKKKHYRLGCRLRKRRKPTSLPPDLSGVQVGLELRQQSHRNFKWEHTCDLKTSQLITWTHLNNNRAMKSRLCILSHTLLHKKKYKWNRVYTRALQPCKAKAIMTCPSTGTKDKREFGKLASSAGEEKQDETELFLASSLETWITSVAY